MKRKKETYKVDIKSMNLDYAEDLDMFSNEDEIVHKVKKILWHKLSEPERRILLIYSETASLRTTASILRMSPGTVLNKIKKIRKNFKCIYS